ncbi:MAG: phospholipid carrier-dependent glycosyltransferase [Christensenellales bacterium]|jgi:dolichyl-phosphate-mannose-protein mannosyltransferase
MKRRLWAILIICLLLVSGHAFAQEENLLLNSDFETLDDFRLPVDWETDAWEPSKSVFMITEDAHSGQYAIAIINQEPNDARFTQTVAVQPQTIYRLSAYINAQGADPDLIGAHISILDAEYYPDSYTNTQNEWVYYEQYVKTAQDQHELVLAVRLGGYSNLTTGFAWFDSVELCAVESVPVAEAVHELTESSFSQKKEDLFVYDFAPVAIFVAIVFAAMVYFIYKRGIAKAELLHEAAQSSGRCAFVWIMAVALVIKIVLALMTQGHQTDIACFKGWASLTGEGLSNFYTSGVFTDYPPGYMYILALINVVKTLFGIPDSSRLFILLLKLPAIIADLLSAWLVYRAASKKLGKTGALPLCMLIALNPVYILNSSLWGQIDSIMVLFCVLAIYLILRQKTVLGCVAYTAALLIKAFSLFFLPVIGLLLIYEIVRNRKKGFLRVLLGVGLSVALFLLAMLPFKGDQPFFYFTDKYIGTATSYPYASINAFNLMSLLGGNWQSDGMMILGAEAKVLGYTGIISIILFTVWMFYKTRDRLEKTTFLIAAFMITGIYVLGHYMHERYNFPVLLLLILAYIEMRDKRLIALFAGFSATQLVNAAIVLEKMHFDSADPILLIGSAINILLFIYLCVVCASHVKGTKLKPPKQEACEVKPAPPIYMPRPKKLGMTRKDMLLMLLLTAVYAAVALINLGSTVAPETYYRTDKAKQAVIIELDSVYEIGEFRYFEGIGDGELILGASEDGVVFQDVGTYEQEYSSMYKWQMHTLDHVRAKYLRIEAQTAKIWLYEVAFADQEGNLLPIIYIEGDESLHDGSAVGHLTDEQHMVPALYSYENSMYFDEIYHGRTAFEHLNGISPYENSHPPLGKLFIASGIALFGMNPFGWRIMGTLFGVAMVPLLYMFGKRLFRRTRYAFVTAFLFTFDFMHFVQTRIATIDSYGVFFILIMFYFMYKFYASTNYNTQPLRKCLLPLGLCGVMFGLGIASKWIVFYAAAGLAVMFFTYLYKRHKEYTYALHHVGQEDTTAKDHVLYEGIIHGFHRKTGQILLFCILFFIIIPTAIYFASYAPYWMVVEGKQYDLEGVWGVQEFMFSYHSKLTAGHPYSSQWWQWPFNIRPTFFYSNTNLSESMTAGISTFGNPIVWIGGLIAVIGVFILTAKGRFKRDTGIFLMFTGIASNYLPWVIVTRATFTYHYFATVPFLVFAIVYFIRYLEKRYVKLRWLSYTVMGAVLLLFCIFYPALSGVPVSKEYAFALRWLPSWVLFI